MSVFSIALISKQMDAYTTQKGHPPEIVLLKKREIDFLKETIPTPYRAETAHLGFINDVMTFLGLRVVQCKRPPDQRVYG